MRIKFMYVENSFKYLWLKEVTGVDLMQHCARCLLGDYIESINTTQKEFYDIELSNNIHYLCGVAFPFNYDNNFHLAFRPKEDSFVYYTSNGITIEIEGAERLPISLEHINPLHPKAKFKSYNTCRNWQFANYLKNTTFL